MLTSRYNAFQARAGDVLSSAMRNASRTVGESISSAMDVQNSD